MQAVRTRYPRNCRKKITQRKKKKQNNSVYLVFLQYFHNIFTFIKSTYLLPYLVHVRQIIQIIQFKLYSWQVN